MDKRKTEDIYEVRGRTFVLKKFDPMVGNYILMQILTMTLPFGLSSAISKAVGANIGGGNTMKMSKEDFIDLQKDILSFVYEQLPGNITPVINSNGSYGVMDLDMMLCFQLIVSCLAFNFSDFFGDEGFAGLLTGSPISNTANTQT